MADLHLRRPKALTRNASWDRLPPSGGGGGGGLKPSKPLCSLQAGSPQP